MTERIEDETDNEAADSAVGSVVPESKFWSAMAGVLFAIPLGLVAVGLAIGEFESYGLILFCGSPFAVGLGSTIVYGFHGPRSLKSSLAVSQIALVLLGVAIFLLAMEGVLCLVMTYPLAMVLSAFGGWIGWIASKRYFGSRWKSATLALLVVGLPMLMGFEDGASDEFDVVEVTTEVTAQAPSDEVWEQLIDVGALPEPDNPLFERGVGHPTDLQVSGRGEGATLSGEFNTGPVEVSIEEWDEPERLALSVTEHPETMIEWSIYGDIEAPHVEGYFACESGEIRLEDNGDGTTTLVGTTECRQDLGPAFYWSMWSETIIDELHRHVLEDVADRAGSSSGTERDS